jgi:hypothetical protein
LMWLPKKGKKYIIILQLSAERNIIMYIQYWRFKLISFMWEFSSVEHPLAISDLEFLSHTQTS